MPKDPIHLFYQDARGTASIDTIYSGPRIRAIGSDGKIKWATLSDVYMPISGSAIYSSYFFEQPPCYLADLSNSKTRQPSSLLHALLLCDLFDLINDYPEMEWIGDL